MEAHYRLLRQRMVEEQLASRGIVDQRVLTAMREVPRHLFVPETYREFAYDDRPLPIGRDQTISQPYMVAIMLQALELTGSERALEVGTGSGYQAAVLGQLVSHVYTVEVIPELAHAARTLLAALHYDNVEVLVANGSIGWQAEAPYDAIIVAAASPQIPPSLIKQLKDQGRLVLPVGSHFDQRLLRVRKRGERIETEDLGGCAFVPLVGEEGWRSREYPS
ncbi:MAG TPA: protein-L-isoaspartate(D-aspartate) O-methyltransferase [Methylomirabilota bacterium]|jgi:protein-L-isoaspartate(D-aspartate) O-methyltransferase|nr:protein-L-isoaspartate(D-aspartate) O-methyltransferase [Methylomirabilota bacterium]